MLQPIGRGRYRHRRLRQDHQGRLLRHDPGHVRRQLAADDHHFRQPVVVLLQKVAQEDQEVYREVEIRYKSLTHLFKRVMLTTRRKLVLEIKLINDA